MKRTGLTAALALALLTTAGCAASSGGGSSAGTGATTGGTGSSGSTAAAAACTPQSLQTVHSGQFTVATDSPAYAPWFVDDKPSNGKGFESAVAYAVAEKLGYTADQVHWTVEPFDSAIAPTPKNFDVDINEFSITPARAKVVDFSSPYYDVTQAVVTLKGSPIANATTVDALRSAHLGAQKGTTSYDAIVNQIKPSGTPLEFPTNTLAVQALKNGQIDGLVVDLPTALYLTAAEVKGSTIVGQLPPAGGTPEQFGMLLDKDSPLTSCVSKAVDALRADGTLAGIQRTWLTTSAGAPVLK